MKDDEELEEVCCKGIGGGVQLLRQTVERLRLIRKGAPNHNAVNGGKY